MYTYFKLFIFLSVLVFLHCGDSSTAPSNNFVLSKANEDIVLTVQNNTISSQLFVGLADGRGNLVKGKKIDFTVSPATAILSPASALTNDQGIASTTVSWSVDDEGIIVDARVSGTDVSLRLFNTFPPSDVVSLKVVSGDGQIGEPGKVLAKPLVVEALDANGNPVDNALIDFSNDGDVLSFSAEKVMTGGNGTAETFITLNDVSGNIPVSARLSGNEEIAAGFTVFSLGTERILFVTTTEPAGIVIMNPAKPERANVFTKPVFAIRADWSPDGNKIVYVSADDQVQNFGLYTINFDGTGHRLLFRMRDFYDGPSWSPLGDFIVFSRHSENRESVHLFTINVDGTDLRQLTLLDKSRNYSPAWHPDIDKIIFARHNPDQYSSRIYTINPDGTGLELFFGSDYHNMRASWSPDLGKLVYMNGEICCGLNPFVINADGSGETRLNSFGEWVEDPSWSPDGSKIIYSGGVFGNEQGLHLRGLYIMNADGTNKTLLTNDRGGVVSPKWVRKK